MQTSNIFQPLSTNPPPSVIPARPDHPVPRTGITAQKAPISTNKFYANFFLGSQTAPAWTHPYSLAWSKGGGTSKSWGLSIAHVEDGQRIFGPASPASPASSASPAQYFTNPLGLQHVVMSASELGPSTALTTDTLTAFSANVNLLPASSGEWAVSFPLVQGMGFATGIYRNSTPLFQSGVFFRAVERAKAPKTKITKYSIVLEDSSTWLLYAFSPTGKGLQLNLVNQGSLHADSKFDGIVQIAKNPDGDAEAAYDAASGAYASGTTLSGTADGKKGAYTLTFAKSGLQRTTLIMFALPHHVESFSSDTKVRISSARLQTTTKGVATAVVADSWTIEEPKMPTNMGFAPWNAASRSEGTLSQEAAGAIQKVAADDIAQDMFSQTSLSSFYSSGKVRASRGICIS